MKRTEGPVRKGSRDISTVLNSKSRVEFTVDRFLDRTDKIDFFS